MAHRWIALVATLLVVAVACGTEDTAGPPATGSTTSSAVASSTTVLGDNPPTTIPLVSVDPQEAATRGGTPASTTTAAEPAAAPTTASSIEIPATTLAPDATPSVTTAGRGRPLWFSRNGSAVIAAAFDDDVDGVTCPVADPVVLYRQPLGPASRTLAVLGDQQPQGTLARPEPGRAGLLETCEGALTAMWSADEAGNGLLANLTEVRFSQPILAAGSFSVTPRGDAFLGSELASPDTDARVVRIDATTGTVEEVFLGEYRSIHQLADGTYLGATWAGQVRHLDADGGLIDVRPGGPVAVSADGATTAVFTPVGLEVAVDSGPATVIPIPGADTDSQGPWAAVVLPGDRGVVFTRRSAVAHPVYQATLDGRLVELLRADSWGDLVVNGRGTSLATSRPLDDPAQLFAEQTVVVTL